MATHTSPIQLPELTADELSRYSRHLILPEVGMEGQQKLKAARVLCVGTGGLGSPLALYLAAAGVGTLGLVDFDVVDASNLQRQIIHSTTDIGRKKLDSAAGKTPRPQSRAQRGQARNHAHQRQRARDPQGLRHRRRRHRQLPHALPGQRCLRPARQAQRLRLRLRFEGQASVFATREGPCYRCLYPEPPPPGLVPSCAEGGVLGILPGLVGVIQATEVIKLILGKGEPLIGRLLLVDALAMRFRELKLRKNPECPVCGANPTVTQLIDYQQFCGIAPETQQETGSEERHSSDQRAGAQAAPRRRRRPLHPRRPRALRVPDRQHRRHAHSHERSAQRLAEIDRNREIVVQCRSGIRSQRVAEFLAQSGYSNVRNLAGGILAWADQIDPKVPKY